MSDTYLLSLDTRVQTLSATRGFSTLVRETVSALEVQYINTAVVALSAQADVDVSLGPINRLRVIAVKSTTPCRVSVVLSGPAQWSLPTTFYLAVLPATAVGSVGLQAAAAGTAEVVLAGDRV